MFRSTLLVLVLSCFVLAVSGFFTNRKTFCRDYRIKAPIPALGEMNILK